MFQPGRKDLSKTKIDLEEQKRVEKRAQAILNNLGFKSFDELKGKTILDIGSGQAEFGLGAKKKGINVICSDVDPENQKKGIEQGLDYRIIDALNIPLKDNSFDLVLSHGSVPIIFHRREQLILALKEVKRILKKGGEFRFGPTHLVASLLDLETLFTPGEEKTLTQEENSKRRRQRSLEIL
jgi:ubiquinone/menaquinone biosynthesis C-methylase UbiE